MAGLVWTAAPRPQSRSSFASRRVQPKGIDPAVRRGLIKGVSKVGYPRHPREKEHNNCERPWREGRHTSSNGNTTAARSTKPAMKSAFIKINRFYKIMRHTLKHSLASKTHTGFIDAPYPVPPTPLQTSMSVCVYTFPPRGRASLAFQLG